MHQRLDGKQVPHWIKSGQWLTVLSGTAVTPRLFFCVSPFIYISVQNTFIHNVLITVCFNVGKAHSFFWNTVSCCSTWIMLPALPHVANLQQNLKHVCDNPLVWNTSLLSSGPLYFSRRDNQISVVWRSSITHTHTPQPPELKWKQQLESISMVVRVCFIIPSSGYLWIKAKLSEHMIAAPQQNPWCIMLFNWLVYMNKGPPHGLKLIIPLPVKELR